MSQNQKPKFKRYELKVAISYGEGQTRWKTIGCIFAHPDTHLVSHTGKAAGFVLDWPEASGIVVPAEKKDKKNENPSERENDIDDNFENDENEKSDLHEPRDTN